MNMLYIIVGLIIVLLIAVIFLHKNKTSQTRYVDNKTPANRINTTPADTLSDRTSVDNTTQFDNIAVAQRFIEQQRYDKAIETLERGLADNPHDTKLLVKLLSIFVETDEQDRFNSTYETIKTYGDSDALEQADTLKELLEPNQITKASGDLQTLPLEDATLSFKGDNLSDDMSLDFDMPVNNENSVNDDQNFDLTLADLETLDVNATTEEPIFKVENMVLDDTNAFDDFELSLPEQTKSASTDYLNISEDGLVLDFDQYDSTQLVQADTQLEPLSEDADLSFEAVDISNNNDVFEISDYSNKSQDSIEPSLSLDDDSVFDITPVVEDDSIDFSEMVSESDVISAENNMSPVEDFDFDALSTAEPTAITPVSTDDSSDEQESATIESATIESAIVDNVVVDDRFAAQFAADFDFVNILDNQQVTLDLAEQYLQLGEYDSAKRLLSEVIEQGSSEQQQLAQELLSRTA